MGQVFGFFRIIGQLFGFLQGRHETDAINIANGRNLTDHQGLSTILVSKHLASIAITYLNIPQETVENISLIRQGDYLGSHRDVLIMWRNKNRGENQVQVSENICEYICHPEYVSYVLFSQFRQMSGHVVVLLHSMGKLALVLGNRFTLFF